MSMIKPNAVVNPTVKTKRKYLSRWIKGLMAILIGGVFLFKKKGPKPSLKMLTQDGQLVEIDPSAFIKRGGKIATSEIQNWIKK